MCNVRQYILNHVYFLPYVEFSGICVSSLEDMRFLSIQLYMMLWYILKVFSIFQSVPREIIHFIFFL